MEMIDLFMKIIEQQGIVALVLLLMMFQNRNERSELLRKNCELSHFIMDLLQRTLPSNVHADHDDGTTRDQP